MATAQRIYLVTNNKTGEQRLVRSSAPSQALSHVARQEYDVRIPTNDESYELGAKGIQVESIKNPDQLELPA